MINCTDLKQSNKNNPQDNLDMLIAQLNIMTTEFMMREHFCFMLSTAISTKLEQICKHDELSFFPNQQQVYIKMLGFWKNLNFRFNKKAVKH